MGALGLLLDAACYALSSVSGASGWFSPTSSCSAIYALKHANDARTLRHALVAHSDSVSNDAKLLAAARIAASTLLRNRLLNATLKVKSAEIEERQKSVLLLRTRGRAWTRLGDAEIAEERANILFDLSNSLCAAIALHDETIRIINSCDDIFSLPSLLIAACRQAGALLDAIRNAPNANALTERVTDAVRMAAEEVSNSSPQSPAPLQSSTSNDNVLSNTTDITTTPLLRRGVTATIPHTQGMSPADVRRTLEAVRSEILDGAGLHVHVERAIRADTAIGLSSVLRRAPVWYAEVTVGMLAASRYLAVRSSTLGGSGELENALAASFAVSKTFLSTNVVAPTSRLYKQIFRSAPLPSASWESVHAGREALRAMLRDYTKMHLRDVPGALEAADKGDMTPLLNRYVEQVRHPTRELMFGKLAQTALVQVQKLKCDVEELVVKSRLTMQAQELNLALVALVPAAAILACMYLVVAGAVERWRRRKLRLVLTPEQTCRFLVAEIHDALVDMRDTLQNDANVDVWSVLVKRGEVALRTHKLRTFVASGALSAPANVVERFAGDAERLDNNGRASVDARIELVRRMWAAYPFFANAAV